MVLGWTLPHGDRWTVANDLSLIQRYLHDPDESFIARDELLDHYRDAYRQLVGHAQSTRQWTILDLPPRYTMAHLYPWESAYVFGGTSQMLGYHGANGSVYTSAWEVEQADVVPVSDGAAVTCTQLWEFAYLPDDVSTDQYFTLGVNRSSERIARVYFDHKALTPRSVSELDRHTGAWWREGGEAWIWTRGTGGPRHFDIYQLQAEYQQGYDLRLNESTASSGVSGFPLGLVRELSGERTYEWTSDDSATPLGLCRGLSSPDRQYLAQPTWTAPLGVVRDLKTSAGNVMLWEIVLPDVPTVQEADTPLLVPAQLQKYLRAYVLWKAFVRQGELQRPELAAWWEQRWLRGIALMKRLGFVTRRDRTYQRQGTVRRSGPARPRLANTFARL